MFIINWICSVFKDFSQKENQWHKNELKRLFKDSCPPSKKDGYIYRQGKNRAKYRHD